MRIEIAWRQEASSDIYLTDAQLQELHAAGVDITDQGAVGDAVFQWVREQKTGWSRREIEYAWTEKDPLEVTELSVWGVPPSELLDALVEADDSSGEARKR